ncbi:MAG: hypothetical protein JJU02_14510 [Cryomorphaceae bacterium]|nr:hypothetical protein [Cryomorphaceae bacterium]
MRIQKSTDKEDFGRKGLFRADSIKVIIGFISCFKGMTNMGKIRERATPYKLKWND